MSQYDLTCDLKINVGHCDLYFMVQWFYLISRRLFDIWTSYFGIMSQYDRTFDIKINVGHWPIFHGSVILPYILKTIWCMNIILRDYESVWHDIWPQNKCRSLWPIFHGPVILPFILKTIWYMNTLLWDFESVWPDVWPQNICSTLWPIFHGPVILPNSLKLFSGWTSYFGIMSQYDPTYDLQDIVGHCDHIIVHWFCPLSWKLLDVWTSYCRIINQYDPTFDLKINVGHSDLYFMVQWLCLIS